MTTGLLLSETDEEIRVILEKAKTIAVVGASSKPWRDSRGIMQFLMKAGYTVVPVNPNYAEVLEVKCYPDLRTIPFPIDIVTIFRHPDEVLPIITEAIFVRAKTIWMQIGVVNDLAAQQALSAGLTVVMNRCIAVDYRRLQKTIIT